MAAESSEMVQIARASTAAPSTKSHLIQRGSGATLLLADWDGNGFRAKNILTGCGSVT